MKFFFKEWEKLALQALSDVAIEGITGGVDTAADVQESSSVISQSSARISYETSSSSEVESGCMNTTGTSSAFELPLDEEDPIAS